MKSKFLNLYKLVMEDVSLYNGISIAILPGSFKPPHRGHWEMVMNCINKFDKTIVLISNISEKVISNRQLSNTNLKTFIKIKDYANTKLNNDSVSNLLNNVNLNVELGYDTLPTYNSLNTIFTNILQMNLPDQKFNTMILKYLNTLKTSLFTSIRKTANNVEITPEISKEIFEIFSNKYNVNDKVNILISDYASPISFLPSFVNSNCTNCKIYIITSDKDGDNLRWPTLLDSLNSKLDPELNNTIGIDYVHVETMLSAADLRNNINNLTNDYFPLALTETDIIKIKELLNV